MLAVLFFAWRFTPEAYALLVQVQAQTTLWVLVAGFDLYVYFHRRWAQRERGIPRDELGWFAAAIGASYVIVAPLVLALSDLGTLHTGLLLAIIVTEHLSQEFNRLLLMFEKHLQAMTVQLLRNLLWVAFFVAAAMATELHDPLTAFLSMWACGGAFAILAGMVFLRRLTTPATKASPLELAAAASAVLAPSILATLASRSMLSVDRLLASAVLPVSEVAAYGMYVTVGAGALAVTDICIVAFAQPRLVRLLKVDASADELRQGRRLMRRASLQAAAVNMFVSAVGWVFVCVVLAPSFSASPAAFLVIQCAYVFHAMSHTADGALYAQGRFALNLALTLGAAAIFGVLLAAAVWNGLSMAGLSLAVALSFLVLWLGKLAAAERIVARSLGRFGHPS